MLLAIAALLAAVAVGAVVVEKRRWLEPDHSLDRLTQVKPSMVPGAGNGLFAAMPIVNDTLVAELGGRLIDFAESGDLQHRALLPECGKQAEAYCCLEAKVGGGPGAMINFAPRAVNGVDLGLQNVRLESFCRRPYLGFFAVRDIATGEELFTSYGKKGEYDYAFMELPAVKRFFCARPGVDCRERYDWEP
ncbi:MAG: SET domain-containing protein [Myxococcales bacterium]